MESKIEMKPPVKMARIIGILYLVIFVGAGIGEGLVRSNLIVAGDASETVKNIIENEMLFRIGFVSDMIAFMSDLVVAILLYILLKPVNKTLSLVAAGFRLLAHPAIASVNLLNLFSVLTLISGAEYLSVFETEQLNALVLLFLNNHFVGYLIGGVFFGIHLLFLGYLIYRSGYFPRILGILLAIAGLGYLVESFGNFLFPANKEIYTWIVAVPAIIGEMFLSIWLIVKGFNVKIWKQRIRDEK